MPLFVTAVVMLFIAALWPKSSDCVEELRQSEDLEELRARFTVRNAAVGGIVAVSLAVAIPVDVRYLCNGHVWLNVTRQNARGARQVVWGSLTAVI